MRSVLVELGPFQWWAIPVIAGILLTVVLLWRRFERALGEEPAPLDRRWLAYVLPLVALMALALYAAVNHLGPVRIRSYGVMLLAGFTLGGAHVHRVGRTRGMPLPMVVDFVLMCLVSAIIGARGLFVLLALGEYARDPTTILDVWRGGLSFHGGLIGAILGGVLFARWRRLRFSVLLDLAAPGVALGYAITRIGCFLNGCCHGHPTNLPWGIIFPENIRQYPMPVHPTQLYASVGSLAIYFILVAVWPRLHRPGQLMATYFVLYSALRFVCEQTRRGATADPLTFLPALTVGQAACILMALFGLAWFLWLQRLPAEPPDSASVLLSETPAAGRPKVERESGGSDQVR